ncbi:hypothetical protein N431DRAFT_465310 [Stipitochalara longipes BDJ]|nr:hypothetical protein N431DRAFT_465310 [Stipitochalara longipes BDJ]
MSTIDLDSTAVDNDDAAIPTPSTLTLADEEWLVIAADQTNKDDTMNPRAHGLIVIEKGLKTEDELEIVKDVLEAIRAAFREENKTTQRAKSRLAAVMQEMKATKNISKQKLEARINAKPDSRMRQRKKKRLQEAAAKKLQSAAGQIASLRKQVRDMESDNVKMEATTQEERKRDIEILRAQEEVREAHREMLDELNHFQIVPLARTKEEVKWMTKTVEEMKRPAQAKAADRGW